MSVPDVAETIDEFIEFVCSFSDGSERINPFIWRAQARADWDFEPTAVRRLEGSKFGGSNASLEDRVRSYERQLLNAAKSRDYHYVGDRELSELQTLARIRHFGGATRFMDFTRNPLTALWFACNEHVSSDGHVFALNTFGCIELAAGHAEEPIENYLQPNKHKNDVFYWRPTYISDRMHAQQSILVFSRLDREGWSPLQVRGPDIQAESKRIHKIRISTALKEKMVDRWHQVFGYSHDAMFPDIEGFGTQHKPDAGLDASAFPI